MTFNIDLVKNTLDEGRNIEPVSDAVQKTENLTNDLVFFGTKDIARMLKCSIPTARELMHRADFPLISTGKNMKVLKGAFENWAMQRRI